MKRNVLKLKSSFKELNQVKSFWMILQSIFETYFYG